MAKKKPEKRLASAERKSIDPVACVLDMGQTVDPATPELEALKRVLDHLDQSPRPDPFNCPFRALDKLGSHVVRVIVDGDRGIEIGHDWPIRQRIAQRAEDHVIALTREAHDAASSARFRAAADREQIDRMVQTVLEQIDMIPARRQRPSSAISSIRAQVEILNAFNEAAWPFVTLGRYIRNSARPGLKPGTSRAKQKARVEELRATHPPTKWNAVVEIMNCDYPRPSNPWTIGMLRNMVDPRRQ